MITYQQFQAKYGRLPHLYDPDYVKEVAMSKFQVLDIPVLAPGKCANCGASQPDGRKYVDFGLSLDWYGVVYLCSICTNECYEVLQGHLNKKSKPGYDDLFKVIDILREQVNDLTGKVMELADERSDNDTQPDSDDPDDPNLVPGDEVPEIKPRPIKAESRTFEPVTGTGRKNIPSFTDLFDN